MPSELLITVGGERHRVTHITLYPASDVNAWRALITRAQAQLGGVSSGVGFIGSPEWAIGGALVTGAITSALSNAAAKLGVETLNEAAALIDRIRASGARFAVAEIRNIDRPHPKAWRGVKPGSRDLDISKVGLLHRGALLKEHNRSKEDVRNGVVSVDAELDFITLDDDFVAVTTEAGDLQVRWSAVETYRVGA